VRDNRALEGLKLKQNLRQVHSRQVRLASQVFGQAPVGVECCLRKIRSFTGKPESKLSDTALTGVIAGLYDLVWTTSALQEAA